jgi:hypothetical protein
LYNDLLAVDAAFRGIVPRKAEIMFHAMAHLDMGVAMGTSEYSKGKYFF